MQDEQTHFMNDAQMQREQLSALVDGEASAQHIQAVLSFAESEEGQQSWRMYHLIGDVLRSPELAHHSHHDILSGVRAHMAREPQIRTSAAALHQGDLQQIVPAQSEAAAAVAAAALSGAGAAAGMAASAAARAAANASVFRWKLAAGFASVAAVVAVGWGALLAGGGLGSAQGPQLAATAPGTVVASVAGAQLRAADAAEAQPESQITLGSQAQSSSVVAVASPNGQSVMLRDPRLDELLAAHSQASGAPSLQMPASFLRNASFASPQEPRR